MITAEVDEWLRNAPKEDLDTLLLRIKARERSLNNVASRWFRRGEHVSFVAKYGRIKDDSPQYGFRNHPSPGQTINATFVRKLKSNVEVKDIQHGVLWSIKPVYLSHTHVQTEVEPNNGPIVSVRSVMLAGGPLSMGPGSTRPIDTSNIVSSHSTNNDDHYSNFSEYDDEPF